MRSLVDFLTYEVALCHWWLSSLVCFHVKTGFYYPVPNLEAAYMFFCVSKILVVDLFHSLCYKRGVIVQHVFMQFELLFVIKVDR